MLWRRASAGQRRVLRWRSPPVGRFGMQLLSRRGHRTWSACRTRTWPTARTVVPGGLKPGRSRRRLSWCTGMTRGVVRSFVDARRVIPDLLSRLTHLPAFVFGLVPILMGHLTPPGPVDLGSLAPSRSACRPCTFTGPRTRQSR